MNHLIEPLEARIAPAALISITGPDPFLEGNSGTKTVSFKVSLSEAAAEAVTVHYTSADGTAASADNDYTSASGVLNFGIGEVEKTIDIVINGDTKAEPNESFSVVLSDAAGPADIDLSKSSAAATILDDEPPVISITGPDDFAEGQDPLTPHAVTFTATLSKAAPAGGVTVRYATSDGSATTIDRDYTAANDVLSFAQGETSKTFNITINGDTKFENNETFSVTLSQPTSATLDPAKSSVPVTILNDDAVPTVSFTTNNPVVEGGVVQFEVKLSNASIQPVTVTYTTVNGTAEAGSDFTAVAGTLVFSPGQMSKVISVSTSDDNRYEPLPNETFSVVLTSADENSTISTTNGTGTASIIDNDAQPTLSIGDVTVVEGNGPDGPHAIFQVILSAPSSETVTVHRFTSNGTALAGSDYVALEDEVLMFAPGETVKQIDVAIISDVLGEADETFFVNLSDPMGAGLAKTQATGTIANDDAAFKIGNAVAVVEGNSGTLEALFEVTLVSPVTGRTATVNFETKDGTATSDASGGFADYTKTMGTLTFGPGVTSRMIAVPIHGDTLFETNENFTVELSGATGADIQGTAKSGTGTITNDDAKPVVSIGNKTVVEGAMGTTGTADFMVTLSNPSTETVTVQYQTVNGTATGGTVDAMGAVTNGDYGTVLLSTLTFAPGEISKTIPVKIRGDNEAELQETFNVQLSNVVNGSLGTATGTGTITNDDGPVVVIRANDTPVSVTEGTGLVGPKFASFVVDLIDGGDLPVTVNYSTVNDTAKAADGDFTAITNQTLTFAKGETSKTISVAILPDSIAEDTESFSIKLSSATNATILAGRDTAVASILDDEPTISIGNVTVIEGSTKTPQAVFTIKLSKAAPGTVVHFETVSETGEGVALKSDDYTETSINITFSGDEIIKTVSVPIVVDSLAEGSETFKVRAFTGTRSAVVATGTIVDPALSIDSVTVVEGSGGVKQAVFTVHLSAPLDREVSASYDTSDDTALAGSDYTAVVGGLLTFAKGETTKTISIPVITDLMHETTETFKVKLSDVRSGVNVPIADATGTITDDDPIPVVTIDNQTILEGNPNGVKQAVFTLHLSAPSSEAVSVTVKTSDGTASTSTDNDYVIKDQVVTFAPGEVAQTFTVDVLGDTRGEADETFTVNLSSPVNLTLGTAIHATGTILNDDAALSIAAPSAISEGGSGVFTVTLSQSSTDTVTVDYVTQAGTAMDGVDYETGKGTLVFAPGETVKTITVASKTDTLAEADETFKILLSNAQNAGLVTATATGTITENALLSIDDISIQEGDSGMVAKTFTVTRSGNLSKAVTVDWATKDGTAKDGVGEGSGLADYMAGHGTLSFAANETSKTISVTVNGDTFKEGTETFQVELSAPQNASILKSAGTASILDEASDSTIGISILDAKVVEGAQGAKTSATFRVELSAASDVPITFTAATVRGLATAQARTDYTELMPTVFTIVQGKTFIDVPVEVIGNDAFENGITKTFSVQISGLEGNMVPVIGLDTKATGFIYNDDMLLSADGRTVQYMDVDGDVATIKVSKGRLTSSNLTFGSVNAVGGRQLQLIDLTNQPQFSHANLSVTARTPAGFPTSAEGGFADGKVNVGWIKAVIPDQNLFRFTGGVDLGTVVVQGDLARIDSGDNFITPAIRRLEVNSFGAVSGTMPLDSSNAAIASTSLVISTVNNFIVHENFAGALYVYGGKFGDINSLSIGGTLGPVKAAGTGMSDYGMGLISFTGTLAKSAIGSIAGGAAENSGQILGDINSGAVIGKITVLGDMAGGTAALSGSIQAININSVTLGSLHGGSGLHSGTVIANGGRLGNLVVHGDVAGAVSGDVSTSSEVAVSGSIFSSQSIGKVLVEGNLQGGISPNSGTIQTNGGIGSIVIGKNVAGGSGSESGAIILGESLSFSGSRSIRIEGDILGGTGDDSGGITASGALGKVTVNGNIKGGNSGDTDALIRSGFIKAAQISSITVGGDLIAGIDGGSGKLAASGAILATGGIGSLTIAGSVTGNSGFSALIAADSFKTVTLATKQGASVNFAEILAGYTDTFAADSSGKILGKARLGVASDAAAQIGKVFIGGNVQATDIVAGAVPGADERFGSLDDARLASANPLISRIASVIVKGSVTATANTYGIVAQRIDSVTVAGSSNSPVIPQPGSTLAIVPIVAGSNWNAVRLGV